MTARKKRPAAARGRAPTKAKSKAAARKTPPQETDESTEPRSGRSIWSGTITFGLVNIPVDFYAAHRPREAQLRMVTEDGHPVGRRYFCPRHDQPVPTDELVRAFELESGEMVVLDDEDIEAAAPDKTRDIDLQRFVPLADLPELMFKRGYVLAPARESTKAYRLLAETMEAAGRVGIATFVMREKAHIVAILATGGVLRAEILRFVGELRTPEGIGLPAPPSRVARARLKEVLEFVDALSKDELDWDELADEAGKALTKLAERKAKRGEDVTRGDAESDEDGDAPLASAIDLVALLKERLEKSGALTGSRSGKAGEAKKRSAG